MIQSPTTKKGFYYWYSEQMKEVIGRNLKAYGVVGLTICAGLGYKQAGLEGIIYFPLMFILIIIFFAILSFPFYLIKKISEK